MGLDDMADIVMAIRELDALANTLGMPEAERRNILGLNAGDYRAWQAGTAGQAAPELLRRLGYALPLLRRMAAHTPLASPGPLGPRNDVRLN